MGPVVFPERHIHQGIGWGGWLLWILLVVAFWTLVIMLILWLVRSFRGGGAGPGIGAPAATQQVRWVSPTPVQPRSSAEQILAERYARGEIDEHEYRSRLDVLRGGPGTAATATYAAPPPPEAPPDPSGQ